MRPEALVHLVMLNVNEKGTSGRHFLRPARAAHFSTPEYPMVHCKQLARGVRPNDLVSMHASQHCCMRFVVALLLLLVMEVVGLTLRVCDLCFF